MPIYWPAETQESIFRKILSLHVCHKHLPIILVNFKENSCAMLVQNLLLTGSTPLRMMCGRPEKLQQCPFGLHRLRRPSKPAQQTKQQFRWLAPPGAKLTLVDVHNRGPQQAQNATNRRCLPHHGRQRVLTPRRHLHLPTFQQNTTNKSESPVPDSDNKGISPREPLEAPNVSVGTYRCRWALPM